MATIKQTQKTAPADASNSISDTTENRAQERTIPSVNKPISVRRTLSHIDMAKRVNPAIILKLLAMFHHRHRPRQQPKASQPYRRIWRALMVVLLVSGGIVQPDAIAQVTSAPPGTVSNQATGSFEDPTDSSTTTLESNIVTVTVTEIAGITVTNNGFTEPTDGNVNTGETVFVDFVITNAGNDPTQFVIPGVATVTNGTQNGDIQIIAYDADGTEPGAPVDITGDNITVPSAGEATGVLLNGVTGTNNGSVPAGGSITVRVPVTAGTVNTDLTVVLGDAAATDGQNEPYVAGTNDVFTQDNADPDETSSGAPINGEREAEASFTTTIQPPLGIYGTVFEDVNYGGGAGRDLTSSSGVVRPNVRVELYDAAGDFVAADFTDALGTYQFTSGITDGQDYTVRVVNDTVTSSRTLNATFTTADTVAVQTYRYDPDATTPEITDEVGGAQPALADSGLNSTSANLSTLTTATNTAQSISTFTLSGPATNVDFGYNFDTIVNTNDGGQGSLRQFVSNSNALDNTGLAQELPGAITAPLDKDGNAVTLTNYETSIFMIPDPNTDARVTVGQTNLSTTPPDGGTGSAFIIDISVLDTLNITDPFTSIDGRTQSVNIPTVSNTPNLTVGSNETTGVEVIIQKTSTNTVLSGRADNTIFHSIGVVGDTTTNAIPMLFSKDGGNEVQTAATSNIIVDSVTIANSAQCGVWGVQMVDSVVRDSVIRDTGDLSLCDNIQLRHDSTGNLIDNNLILRSQNYGIDIVLDNNENNIITNNQIVGNGLAAGGQNAGIGLRGGSNNLVQNNIIRDNNGAGIDVIGDQIGNQITQNTIFNNGELGIDLVGDGPTLNDAGDSDIGDNALQNYPVITSVASDGTNLTVQGTLNSTSNGTFDVELYSNAVCNPGIDGIAQADPYGEGEKYHQTLSVNTDGSGDGTFSTTIPVADLAGTVVSATATDAAGNTSEFSECNAVSSNPDVVLVKRITAINGDRTENPNDNTPLNTVVNDGTANSGDDEANWPTNYLLGAINAGIVNPGDDIEYTVYYLNGGVGDAEQVRICDWIQPNQSVETGLYSGNDIELQTGEGAGSTTYTLTTANDAGDRAQLATVDALPAGPICNLPAASAGSTDDVLVIDITGTTGDPSGVTTTLPGSSAPGTPDEAFGFFRFTTKIAE